MAPVKKKHGATPSQELVSRSFTIFPSGLPHDLLISTAETFRSLGVEPTDPASSDYFSYSLEGPGPRPRRGEAEIYFDLEHGGTFFNLQIFPAVIDVLASDRRRTRRAGTSGPSTWLTSNFERIDVLKKLAQKSKDPRRRPEAPKLAGHERIMQRNIDRIRAGHQIFRRLGESFAAVESLLGLDANDVRPGLYFLTSYLPNDNVFGHAGRRPCHRDSFVRRKEVLISIQLTPSPCIWTVGREEDSLEVVTQNIGDVIVLDNYGQMWERAPRHNPIHHVVAGSGGRNALLLSFTEENHQRALDFLDLLAPRQGWRPAPPRSNADCPAPPRAQDSL